MQKSVGNQAEIADNGATHRDVSSTPVRVTQEDNAPMSSSASDHTSTPGKSPAFQFYAKEFLSDANQAGMSLQETGAYIRLICFEWNEHGKGIPDDAVRCARMVGASVGSMRKMWPTLRSCFIAHDAMTGRLVHPRLERERENQADYRRRQSDNGKRGGRPRKPKESQTKPTANPNETQPLTQTEAKKSSPISDLRSAFKTKRNGSEQPDEGIAQMASDVMEFYPEVYAQCRSGAVYRTTQVTFERDWPNYIALAETYPDPARLRAMLEIFLTRDLGDKSRPGTPGQFRHMAAECDEVLRRSGWKAAS